MSFNQSRSDKSDNQYRKIDRSASSNQQRNSSGGFGRGGSGGGVAPALSQSNRSFKKTSAVNSSELSNLSVSKNTQNGVQVPQVSGALSNSSGAASPTGSVVSHGSSKAVPKTATFEPATMTSDTVMSKTPEKTPKNVPGDVSKAFPFQFGSISPGFMNGMQIPARTNSAPPNLDEQNREQARNDCFKSVPSFPVPSVPKQQSPTKDASAHDHSKSGDIHPATKTRKESQLSPAPLSSQPVKQPAHSMTGISVPINFHQPQVPVQFGGPNPQIQSQGMAPSSLQMPMSMQLPMGSASQMQQQQMFVPGIQAHLMPPQGIMHQGQTLSFTSQMGPQLPTQLGNFGISMQPQYPQQQSGNFGGPRKTPVKITDPKTREELRFDKRTDTSSDGGSSASKPHPNIPPQAQLTSSFPSHPVNYYPGSIYFPATSLSPTGAQMTSNPHPPRFSYHVGQAHQHVSMTNPSVITPPVSQSGTPVHGIVEQPSSAPSVVSPVTIKLSASSIGGKVTDSLLPDNSIYVEKEKTSEPSSGSGDVSSFHTHMGSDSFSDSTSQYKPGKESLTPKPLPIEIKQSSPVSAASAEALFPSPVPASAALLTESATDITLRDRKTLGRSNSIIDQSKKAGDKGNIYSNHESSEYADRGVLETMEGKTTLLPSMVYEVVSGSTVITIDTSESKIERVGEAACISPRTSSSGTGLDNTGTFHEDKAGEEPGEIKLLPEIDANNIPEIYPPPISSEVSSQSRQAYALIPLPSEGPQSGAVDNLEVSTSVVDTSDAKIDTLTVSSSDYTCKNDVNLTKFDVPVGQFTPVVAPDIPEATWKHEGEGIENIGGDISIPAAGFKEKPITELNRSKSMAARGKKKKKEILRKADAAGTTSDLYNAYKGREEKKETVISLEGSESVSAETCSNQAISGSLQKHTSALEKNEQSKYEPDDWEDAAELSTPKLEEAHEKDGNEIRKYSRDFLLKFAELCIDLPKGTEITSDIVDTGMSNNVNFPSPGRIDRPTGAPRLDRRGSNIVDDDRWNRGPGSFGPGRELRPDISHGGNVGRSGQGGNYGALRNPRMQSPGQYAGGILSGPLQSPGSQGGMQRNNPEAERWQRATNFQQKSPFPSIQTPLQTMHKAERKYEIGTVTDEEQAKQRRLKAILNKLTPQNFEKLFEQVKAVNIDNARTLTGVISQIFDKALMEPTFCEMYANFCFYLAGELPDFTEDNEKITFKRLLLNKCQEEFERGEREEEEAKKVDDEGGIKQSEEEREEKRIKVRRRMLGNIRLIGELFKKRMLTEKIMHECIKKLLGEYQNPDEEDVEALCKLMSTIGEMIDHLKAKPFMDAYFDMMTKLSNNMKLSSRIRFLLKDTIDLRKNKWQQRRKVEGPKKIEEVHRDAAQERQAQTSRLARGPSMNSSRRGPSTDFGPRVPTMLPSPNAQMGGFRGGFPTQNRGFGIQDARWDDRQPLDARTLLPQRPGGDDSITLGPQGGLARGMSIRGSPSMFNTTGLNGYGSAAERASHGSREDIVPRNVPDRHRRGPVSTQNDPPEKVWPEERLRELSLSAIKEFYSARDEKEVALCIKELNAPSFHPSMISLWVTDSFERKNMERDVLAKLLVNLTKPMDGVLSQPQLIKGFESVLTTLEDAVNDAPKVPEYIGNLFARVVLDDVISLREVGQLIHEGGEERGSLLEVGLAADVLGTILETINSEKGETVLNEYRKSSNLVLETFRPPGANRSRKLDKFM